MGLNGVLRSRELPVLRLKLNWVLRLRLQRVYLTLSLWDLRLHRRATASDVIITGPDYYCASNHHRRLAYRDVGGRCWLHPLPARTPPAAQRARLVRLEPADSAGADQVGRPPS
jgi:hypothetical protein